MVLLAPAGKVTVTGEAVHLKSTAHIDATQADVQAAMTVLCAEVARSYFELREADAELRYLEAAIALSSKDAQHAARLADAGIGSRDAALAADARIATARTRLIAEQLGRTCVGLELQPQYCDVIVTRWENLTGQKATRTTP